MKTTDENKNFPRTYRAMPLRDLILVFERAARAKNLGKALAPLKELAKNEPDLGVLFPEQAFLLGRTAFLAMSICSGAAGTASPTVTTAIAKVIGNSISVGFSYTTGATAGCTVTVNTVELQVGSRAVGGAPLYRTAVEGNSSGATGYAGEVDPGKISGGVGTLVGTTQTLRVTFKLDNTKCGDTCVLAAAATHPVTASVVIS